MTESLLHNGAEDILYMFGC